jgi:hypothetical protein
MQSIKHGIKQWIKSWTHCVLCEYMVKKHLMYSDLICYTCYTNKQGGSDESQIKIRHISTTK